MALKLLHSRKTLLLFPWKHNFSASCSYFPQSERVDFGKRSLYILGSQFLGFNSNRHYTAGNLNSKGCCGESILSLSCTPETCLTHLFSFLWIPSPFNPYVCVLAKNKKVSNHKQCYNHTENSEAMKCHHVNCYRNDFDFSWRQICSPALKLIISLRAFTDGQWEKEEGERKRCFAPWCLPRFSVFTRLKSGFSTAALSPSTSIWQD